VKKTLLIIVASFSLVLNAANLRDEQASLRDLQNRIQSIQKNIKKEYIKRDKNILNLEKIDKEIAVKQSRLRDLAISIAKSELEISQIEIKKKSALSNLSIEQKQLAALIQLSHRQQGANALKWLLDMEDPSKLARTMTYYRYLMDAQNKNMLTVNDEVMGIVSLLTKTQQAKDKTLKLKNDNDAAIASLSQDRVQRNRLVQQIENTINLQKSEVQQLQLEEDTLQKLIADLEKTLANFPQDSQRPFKSLKGKLAWPLKGKIQNVYGNYRLPKQGLKWRGLQIKAERNTEIRAIAYGRVVYADWLPGMGLLTIVDHGQGYLSLYGNCEMLFKNVGAWVDGGEVIALVGDSGGSNQVGLYLELRKGKKPFSPQSWFQTRRP